MKPFWIFLRVTFLFFVTQSISSQNIDTLVLRPGPTDGIDAEVRDNMDWPKWDDDDFISNAWTANSEYFIQRSLIKFDLDQIPTGKYIESAKLSLFCNTISGHHQLHAGANSSFLLTVIEPWDQYSVHWSNQPATTMENAIILNQSVSQTQDYTNIEVTDQIDYFYNNPTENYGFMLRLIEEYQYAAMVFASSNHIDPEKRPMLEIVYADCNIPNATFTYSFTNMSGEVQFHSEEDPTVTYFWDFGNGITSNLQNPIITFPAIGTYYVCLTAYNECDTLTFCDSVNTCIPAGAEFTYNFTNFQGEVQFSSQSNPQTTYLWDFGNGDTSNIPNPLYTYPYQGTYLVCLTASSNCDTNTYCEIVNTCDPVSASFIYTQNDHLVAFTPSYQNYSSSYYWNFGDGFYSDLINPEHYYEDEGYYNVCLEIYDDCGYFINCEYLEIIVSKYQSQNIADKLSIFPTLVNSQLNISILDHSLVIKEIQLYNSNAIPVSGSKKIIPTSGDQNIVYDVSDIESGIYIISIITEKSIINKKIIVIRE